MIRVTNMVHHVYAVQVIKCCAYEAYSFDWCMGYIHKVCARCVRTCAHTAQVRAKSVRACKGLLCVRKACLHACVFGQHVKHTKFCQFKTSGRVHRKNSFSVAVFKST